MTPTMHQTHRALCTAPRRISAALIAIVISLLAPASLAQPGSEGDTSPGGGYETPETGSQQPQAGAQTEFEPAALGKR